MAKKKLNELLNSCSQARKNKQFVEATKICNEMLFFYPTNPAALFEEAMLIKDQNDLNYAHTKLIFLLNTEKRYHALLEIGNIYATTKNRKTAIDYYLIIYEELKTQKRNRFNYKHIIFALQKIVCEYKKLKNYNRAIYYSKLLINEINCSNFKNNKDLNYVTFSLGNLYHLTGNLTEAINCFNQLENSSDKYLGKLKLAEIAKNDRQYDYALEILNEIIAAKDKKTYYNAIFMLGCIKISIQDYNGAIKEFNKLQNSSYYIEALEKILYISLKTNHKKNAKMLIPRLEKIYLKKEQANKSKLEKLNNINNQLNSTISYNKQEIINNLEKFYQNNTSLSLNMPISDLVNYLIIKPEDYYETINVDVYYIYIPNIGTIHNQSTDYIKVTTSINTTNILSVSPCKNKNNQLRHDSLKLLLQK